jgi:hypothetical protein
MYQGIILPWRHWLYWVNQQISHKSTRDYFISIVLSKMLYSTFLRCSFFRCFQFMKGPGGSRSWIVGLPNNSCKPISNTAWVRFVNYKKGALDSQPQVIKFTSCLPIVGGSLRVLRRLPPLNWSPWYSWNIAESGVKHQRSIKPIQFTMG